jgi:hypothetical protein
MILSYIPNQLMLGQTCRKFYDLSCSLESYSLTITGDAEVVEFLEDESILASIVNTKRRIDNLKLFGRYLNPVDVEKLQMIVVNIGARLKNLTVSHCNLSTNKAVFLFNSMPQLECIQMKSIKTVGPKNFRPHRNFRLNLPRLKTLEIIDCSVKWLEVFDHLPDDVLKKLHIKYIKVENSKKYFANQTKLKCVNVLDCSANPLKMEQLKLEELSTDSAGEELKLMLKQQVSLKSLAIGYDWEVSQSDFNFICSHLSSLNHFKLEGYQDNIDFSQLADLKQLKTFKIGLFNEPALQSIKSRSLEALEFDLESTDIREETVKALSVNCPSVINLTTCSDNSPDALNWYLKNFPSLKRFTSGYVNAQYTFPYGLTHSNLKELSIFNFEPSMNLLFLLSSLEISKFSRLK